jgi:putative ABC transport system permease protein
MAGASGVRQALAARITDNVPVLSGTTRSFARLVVVDAAAFQRLLAGTPLPDAPQLARLTAAGTQATGGAKGGPVRALLRSSDQSLRQATTLAVTGDDIKVTVTPVGPAPAVGDGDGNLLIVDASSFAAAGAPTTPNTVWLVGPRAADTAVAAAASLGTGSGAVVTLRRDVLASRRSAPLAAGLLHLANASTAALTLLGLLGVLLGAAASAPARGETLARLRTLGLRPRETRRVAVGELLPPVLIGAVGGLLVGVVLAHATLGSLALRLLTGQTTDPALVVPWVSAVPVALLVLAVAVVVQVESSIRRRERLGQVLRAGNG